MYQRITNIMKQRAWHLPVGIISSLVIHIGLVVLLNGGGESTLASPAPAMPGPGEGVEMETYPTFHDH